MEDPVVPLERNLYGHPLARLLSERQFEKILSQHGLEKVSTWECVFVRREKRLFLSVYVDDIKLAGKKQNIDPMWKLYSTKKSIWENQHLSLIMYIWDALKDNVKEAKILLTITEPCLNREFQRGEQKSFHSLRIFVSHGLMTRRVMQRSVWSDIVS